MDRPNRPLNCCRTAKESLMNDETNPEVPEDETPWVAPYGLSDVKHVECRNEDGAVVRR